MAENKEKAEIQIIQNKEAEFVLTPVGQAIKSLRLFKEWQPCIAKAP